MSGSWGFLSSLWQAFGLYSLIFPPFNPPGWTEKILIDSYFLLLRCVKGNPVVFQQRQSCSFATGRIHSMAAAANWLLTKKKSFTWVLLSCSQRVPLESNIYPVFYFKKKKKLISCDGLCSEVGQGVLFTLSFNHKKYIMEELFMLPIASSQKPCC